MDMFCITSSTVAFVQSLKLTTSDGDMKALERVSPPSALVSAFDVPVRLATSDTSGANLKAAQELARSRLQGVGHLAFSCDVHTPHARLDHSARCFCTPRTKLWLDAIEKLRVACLAFRSFIVEETQSKLMKACADTFASVPGRHLHEKRDLSTPLVDAMTTVRERRRGARDVNSERMVERHWTRQGSA